MRAPDHTAQMRSPALDVWASYRGFAVGFIGGPIREIIAEYPTMNGAFAAYRSARDAAAALAKVRA